MTFHPPPRVDIAQIAALMPRLRRFARALAFGREEADDLVQAALERAVSRSVPFQPGTRMDAWMLRILKHAWTEEAGTRQRRDYPFALDDEGEQGGDPAVHQQRLAVRKAVNTLSEDHRIVIGLVLVDGLPYKEAAAVLEIPLGALMSRLARAREALQGLLSDQARNMA